MDSSSLLGMAFFLCLLLVSGTLCVLARISSRALRKRLTRGRTFNNDDVPVGSPNDYLRRSIGFGGG